MDSPGEGAHGTGSFPSSLAAPTSDSSDHTALELQQHLGLVCDNMFEGVTILDFDFRYVYLNNTAVSQGRLPRAELLGRRMEDVYPAVDQTEVFGMLQRTMADRTPRHMLTRFTYPDGQEAWFDLRLNPVPMGILILSVDVTDLKVAEEQLHRSRDDLATTLECMADGMVTTDVHGRIVRMNPSAEELIGCNEAECKGRRLDEKVRFQRLYGPRSLPDPVAAVLAGELPVRLADVALVRRDRTSIPVSVSGARIRGPDGDTVGVVLVLKSLEGEHELAVLLQQAQKMEAIGRLAGGIAHDFNNLLTVINAYSADLMNRDPAELGFREDLKEIKDAGERATALTRQLLAFSRRQVLNPEVVDLNGIVERIEGMLRRLLGADIDLVTSLDPNLDAVFIDPGQLEQIVMNLAVNARDAMPMGGKLTIETRNVNLDEEYARTHVSARAGPHVLLAVTDTGVGMDESIRGRVFEPFFTTKPVGQGTGLGLSTVYGIVKQSGGNIWVYSEVGSGTTFKVYLPRTEARHHDPAPQLHEGPPVGGSETILLVEDDPAVRRLIRGILERAGYTVLDAAGPREALERFSEHADEIDLLLTDVILPEMGGRAVAERILSVRPQLKVVYMSGYTDDAIVHHGVLTPGTAFIEKPITADVLLSKLRGFLD